MSQSRKRDECVIFVGVPETAFRTFSEMVAAVLYLVRLYIGSTLWLFRRGMGGRMELTCRGWRECSLDDDVSSYFRALATGCEHTNGLLLGGGRHFE